MIETCFIPQLNSVLSLVQSHPKAARFARHALQLIRNNLCLHSTNSFFNFITAMARSTLSFTS
jgi:hypothetical protein